MTPHAVPGSLPHCTAEAVQAAGKAHAGCGTAAGGLA